MYSIEVEHRIFSLSNGEIWDFFYVENQGICFSKLTLRKSWSPFVSIHKEAHPGFFVRLDNRDVFHMLFQDKKGNIYYSTMNNEIVKNTPLLNSKSLSSYNKHLKLFLIEDNIIHTMFVIEHNKNVMLAHQTLTGSQVSSPQVIDYVIKGNDPYCAVCDHSNNIFVFYQSSDGDYLQIGYKKYVAKQKIWGEFIPVTRSTASCERPYAIVDNNDILHLCYHRNLNGKYELIYQKKLSDKNVWTVEQAIYTSVYPFSKSYIIQVGEKLIIYWVEQEEIFYSYSNNEGKTWDKVSTYIFSAHKKMKHMSYKSNLISDEHTNMIAYNIPGAFINNGIKFAFCQVSANAQSSNTNISANEFSTMIIDSFKLLKDSIEDLKRSYRVIHDDITKLNMLYQTMQREMIKFSIKLDVIEGKKLQAKVVRKDSRSHTRKEDSSKTNISSGKKLLVKSSLINNPSQRRFKLIKVATATRYFKKIS